MTPCGVVICKVFGLPRPSLTNRMSELLTYGSVGGVGSNPGPYPAIWRECATKEENGDKRFALKSKNQVWNRFSANLSKQKQVLDERKS